MIASARGLAGLTAVAAVLAGVLVVDVRRTPARVDTALVPGLDPAQVTALRWERAGAPAVTLTRSTPDAWRWGPPVDAPADEAAVASVLAALRGARWQRRAPIPTAGEVTTRLVITGAGAAHTIGIGREVAGAEQTWLAVDARALLVDAWVARALAPAPVALVIAQPLDGVGTAAAIAVGDVALAGSPRRRVDSTGQVVVDGTLVRDLERALAALTIEALPAVAPSPSSSSLSLQVGDVTGTLTADAAEACGPGRALLATTRATGCVARADADAVIAAAQALARDIDEVIERRPAPLAAVAIVLPDGARLALDRAPRIDGDPADVAAIAPLLAALRTPGTPVVPPVTPPGGAPRTLVVEGPAGASITLELLGDGLVRRRGEPRALRLAPEAWRVLGRSASALREVALWIEEPLMVTAVELPGVTYARGATLGEWTRTPAGAIDREALEALVRELAGPRARGGGGALPPGLALRRVIVRVTPPAGPPVVHALEVGALAADGCPARIDGRGVMLQPALCTALDALVSPTR